MARVCTFGLGAQSANIWIRDWNVRNAIIEVLVLRNPRTCPTPPGSDKVLGLRNTSTSIIAFLTFQSRIHMLADYAPRPNVHTLSHGRALYCIRAPGLSRTYVAKEPYSGLGLIV